VKDYFLRRSVIEITNLSEEGNVRGSPLAVTSDTWQETWMHCTSNQWQVTSRGVPFSGGSCSLREDCRQPRLARVLATTKSYWDVHVHHQ